MRRGDVVLVTSGDLAGVAGVVAYDHEPARNAVTVRFGWCEAAVEFSRLAVVGRVPDKYLAVALPAEAKEGRP